MMYRTVFTDINLWSLEDFEQYADYVNELTVGAHTVQTSDIRNMEDDDLSKENVDRFKFLIGLDNYEKLLNGELDLVIIA